MTTTKLTVFHCTFLLIGYHQLSISGDDIALILLSSFGLILNLAFIMYYISLNDD